MKLLDRPDVKTMRLYRQPFGKRYATTEYVLMLGYFHEYLITVKSRAELSLLLHQLEVR